jgi:hypothetical protein
MAARHPNSVLRTTIRISVGFALVAVVAGIALRHPDLGILASLGLLLGAGNMYAADKLFGSGTNATAFMATSGVRLVVLTLSAFAVFAIFHERGAIVFVLGAALSQFTLSASAVVATTVNRS